MDDMTVDAGLTDPLAPVDGCDRYTTMGLEVSR